MVFELAIIQLKGHAQVCNVQFLDIKQNGQLPRSTVIIHFVLRLNVSRLLNVAKTASAIYIYLALKATKACFNHTVSHMWSVFFAPYANTSKSRKVVVKISDLSIKMVSNESAN